MSTLRKLAEAVIRRLPARLQPMARWRFVKFGLVGGSGTVINIAVLYASQEYLLRGIADFHTRLNYSIALAITLATISNFYWNRRLTWRDRRHEVHHSSAYLFFKYVMAAALSIVVQTLTTKWLALHMHYLLANVIAIVLASVVNFIANDRLTFRRHRPKIVPTAPPDSAPASAGSDGAAPSSSPHDKT